MVVVPAGSYMMGSERGGNDNERPRHQVTLSKPFAVGVYEVTRGEWRAFVRATGYDTGSCSAVKKEYSWRYLYFSQDDRHPVVCVNYEDAHMYVQWLSRKTGQGYRLLSESEWEYVARAGTTTTYHTGARIFSNQANFNDKNEGTVEVGSYAANAFGLYDVHGNVFEWVQDCWNGSYEGAPNDGSAWESGDCGKAVLRGGSWLNNPEYLRSAYRLRIDTGLRYYYDGFRLARTLTP